MTIRSESDKIASQKVKIISSKELFGEQKQILVQHGELIYRLMITRQGKLILNK